MLRPTYDFVQKILSHGDKIEVIEPESLRNNISDIIRNQQEPKKTKY